MSLSIQKMVSDGTLSTIVLGVQYLQRNDVYVRIAGVETPQSGAPSGYTWSFLDNSTIRVLPVVPAGVEVVVYRRTDLGAMYNIYNQNAQFDESTIDENNQQLLYISQEYFEQGIPAQLIDSVEYVREDTVNMYYRLKLSDGSYTAEFPIPKGGAAGFEALRRSYADAGLTLVDGSFEDGGVLTNVTDILLHKVSGVAYSWSGALPKIVAAGTLPSSDVKFVSKKESFIRTQLSSAVGAAMVAWVGGEAGKLKKTLEERFNSAFIVDFATEYLTMEEIAQIKIDYTVGTLNQKPTVDITARLIQAIADLGGSHDTTVAYLYEPAKVLQMPSGAMGVNLNLLERFLVSKNNINIRGAGMFNTRLCHIGTGHAQEMFRFKEAYACGLSHMTLDGGMPWRPDGTETYGVDVPLVIDQCAHFYSEGLNLCNYRHRGLQAIHLWESYFDDFRCFNGGWLRTGTTRAPGGIFFDDYLKESTTFSGSESNQVYFGKYAFSGVGAVYHFISPCFNIHFNHVVSEGMTFNSGYIPNGMNVAKVVVDGGSAGVVVGHAWYYFHDQPIIAAQQAVLFDFTNAGPGCKFDNQVVIQEIPVGSSNLLEVSTFANNASAYPVTVNASISDANCTTLFGNAAAGALLQGDIFYRKDTARTIENWMGTYGPSNFIGTVTMSTGAFNGTPPVVYQYDGRSVTLSAIDGSGSFAEYKCRAIANFNGATGTSRMQKGITVTKQSTGTYSATFDKQMPDANYSICHALQKASSNTDSFDIASMTQNGFTFVVKNSAGALVDASIICLSVFR